MLTALIIIVGIIGVLLSAASDKKKRKDDSEHIDNEIDAKFREYMNSQDRN